MTYNYYNHESSENDSIRKCAILSYETDTIYFIITLHFPTMQLLSAGTIQKRLNIF